MMNLKIIVCYKILVKECQNNHILNFTCRIPQKIKRIGNYRIMRSSEWGEWVIIVTAKICLPTSAINFPLELRDKLIGIFLLLTLRKGSKKRKCSNRRWKSKWVSIKNYNKNMMNCWRSMKRARKKQNFINTSLSKNLQKTEKLRKSWRSGLRKQSMI